MKLDFNPKDYAAEPVPEDTYTLVTTKVENPTVKDSFVTYFRIHFKVVRGEFANRYFKQDFHVNNANQDTQRIAREGIARWLIACGKLDYDDLDDCVGVPFRGFVILDEDPKGKFPTKNKVTRFYRLDDADQEEPEKPEEPEEPEKSAKPPKTNGKQKELDDDIPF